MCCPLTPVTVPTVQLCDWLTAESDVQTGTNGVRPQLQEQASIIRDYLLIHPVGVFPLWPETHSNAHRPVRTVEATHSYSNASLTHFMAFWSDADGGALPLLRWVLGADAMLL